MNLDTGILAVTVFLGFWGAFSGASGQLAGWAAFPLGWLASKHGASPLSPHLERATGGSPAVCVAAASVLLFFTVMWASRAVIAGIIRKVLGGGDGERRGLDRTLGFLLGGGRSLVIAWLCLSAWAFAESNVKVSGKQVAALAPPKDSQFYAFAKAHNAFGDGKDFKLPTLPELPKAVSVPGAGNVEEALKRGLQNADRRSAVNQIERALDGDR
jgi:membrane protein required for colicin V production